MIGKQVSILEMKNISKEFPGVKALDNINFTLKNGSVHALMGENGAGKSTLMKCLFGIYECNEGEIFLEGENLKVKTVKQALEKGVSMVHQELNLVRQTSVMDNIWLGRYPTNLLGKIDHNKMYEETKSIFKQLKIDLDPKNKVDALSVSQMQMIEIAKAVSYNSKVIVMDEPTSSLTEKEVNHLFEIINILKNQGVGIIYISHKMDEIFKIADEITIMRDGKLISTKNISDITMDEIITLMVGREIKNLFPIKENIIGNTLLKIKNLTSQQEKCVKDVSFELKEGEILGIAGLVGSKRSELLECIFGLRKIDSGEIILREKLVNNRTPLESIKNKFALVTEERRVNGIFGALSVNFNSTICNIDKYNKKYHIDHKQCKEDTDWVISSMRVKTPSQKTKIENLSGGNQQKIILGKWLLTNPEVLLLDEPTRGIDVGAKFEIYQLILEQSKNGKGCIVVSSEMTELLGIADRILVMSNGRVAGIVDTKSTSQEEILKLSAKYI